MKLKEFNDELQKMIKDNPELLDAVVITAIDDEGNGYNEVFFTPTLGEFDDGEFRPVKPDDEEFNEDDHTKTPNSICIN